MSKIIKKLFIPCVLILIPLLFFYKTVIFQKVPFPGDLLVGNYEPYKSNPSIGVVPHKGQGADVVRELYPWKFYTIDSLKSGFFPFWNPYTFSGNPHFANLQSGVLYPVNIIFFIFPYISAWSIYIILQFVFLMFFTYLFLRQINLSKVASLFGAIAFSFSGFVTVWAWYGNLGHALAFLPLVFYFIEKIYKQPKWYFFPLLIIALVFSIFAGYIQYVMYIYLLSFAYIFSRFVTQKKKNIKLLLLLISCFLLAGLLAAVQLLPVFELVSNSLRSTYSYQVLLERLMPPESMVTLLVPDFFGNPATMNYFLRGGSSLERASSIGVWPLIFVVVALFSKKTFFRNYFTVSSLVIYISVLSIFPIAYFHSIGIPFLSTGIPTRALSIFCFCMAVLSAIGLNAFIKDEISKKTFVKILIFFMVVFAGLWIVAFVNSDPHMLISRRNLILPTFIFTIGSITFLLKIKKNKLAVLLILLTLAELFYYFQKFNSFVPASYMYPFSEITEKLRSIQGLDRFWGYGNANIDSNFQLIEKNYTTAGYDAIFSKRYGEFTAASSEGKIPLEVPRSVADIIGGYGVNDLKQNPYRKRALDITGVKYILNKKGDKGLDSAFDTEKYDLIWENGGWQIYLNKDAVPRVNLVGDYKAIENKDEIIKNLYNLKLNPKETVILEEKLNGKNIKKDSAAKVTIKKYHPNFMSVNTESKNDQILFISDNYFPGWHALVDGVEQPILRANYTFRAVPLEAGKHSVYIYYFPDSFKLGLIISISSFLCLILGCLFVTITKRSGRVKKK